MGLLEKALNYKRKINSNGKKTVMDRIKGPADTEFIDEDKTDTINSSDKIERVGVNIKNSEREDDDILFLASHDLEPIHGSIMQNESIDKKSDDKNKNDEDIIYSKENSFVDNGLKDYNQSHADESAYGIDNNIETRMNEMYKDTKEEKEIFRNKRNLFSTNQDQKFQDYMVLYEISKEIITADSMEELYDIILFSIMGQIGVSSSSIMVPDLDNSDKWIIADSRGVTIEDKELFFEPSSGILEQLIKRKTIIDLEEFKGNSTYKSDYYNYISIDARLLVPLLFNGEVVGVIILGEKLTQGDYSIEEKDFIVSISEFAAHIYNSILYKEKIKLDIDSLKKHNEYIEDIDILLKKIVSEADIEKIDKIMYDYFKMLGISSYSLYIKERRGDNYIPIIVEKEDYLSLKGSKFCIPMNSNFIGYLTNMEGPVQVEGFQKAKIITDIFTDSHIAKMSLFHVYPFKIGSTLLGFILIFNIADSIELSDIEDKVNRLSNSIFSYINNILEAESSNSKYIDNVDIIFKRIEDQIINAKNLKIPLTLILFSIKNFKRYYTEFGHSKAKELIDSFEAVIRSRLSDGDFSIRYDRHKIMIILTGKNKKYAVPFANTIRNEILHLFNKKEMQLLVTFLISEFPEDGEDAYSLVDAVD